MERTFCEALFATLFSEKSELGYWTREAPKATLNCSALFPKDKLIFYTPVHTTKSVLCIAKLLREFFALQVQVWEIFNGWLIADIMQIMYSKALGC